MEQQLTAQDICKLIEVLAKDNEISRYLLQNEDTIYCKGSIGLLYLEFYNGYVAAEYNGKFVYYGKSNIHDEISETINRLYQKKSIEEILNIIHNDKDAK